MIQEGEQFLPVPSQALLQPPGIFLFPHPVDELVQAFPGSGLPPFIDFMPQALLVFLQPYAVLDSIWLWTESRGSQSFTPGTETLQHGKIRFHADAEAFSNKQCRPKFSPAHGKRLKGYK